MTSGTAKTYLEEVHSDLGFHQEAAKLDFALDLKRVMDRENITPAQLAERLSVSRPMVSKLLRGDANVTIETMVKACRSVGGKIFIKILREDCTARLFELAMTAAAKTHENAVRTAASIGGQADGWHYAANDFEITDHVNESQSIAA